jgi:hypothetical protein
MRRHASIWTPSNLELRARAQDERTRPSQLPSRVQALYRRAGAAAWHVVGWPGDEQAGQRQPVAPLMTACGRKRSADAGMANCRNRCQGGAQQHARGQIDISKTVALLGVGAKFKRRILACFHDCTVASLQMSTPSRPPTRGRFRTAGSSESAAGIATIMPSAASDAAHCIPNRRPFCLAAGADSPRGCCLRC